MMFIETSAIEVNAIASMVFTTLTLALILGFGFFMLGKRIFGPKLKKG